MPRYIDAEKIRILTECAVYEAESGDTLVPICDVRRSVAQTKTEDVGRIVKCGECRYYDQSCGLCKHDCGLNRIVCGSYCSYGVKWRGTDAEG